MSNSNNSSMHPRNVYRHKPPDFKQLMIKYPEFKRHCKLELNGKVTLDFKNPDAIRALTATLLKEDFNLSVDLPSDSLVPRVPVRLNYILWLEDILTQNGLNQGACGIDIGTGASCVYPLLGVTQCGWTFVATDRDQTSVDCAVKNVRQNDLHDKIEIVKVNENEALYGVVEKFQGRSFDFCMCNPPFYDNQTVPVEKSQQSQSMLRLGRPGPHSATVAKPCEIRAEGGELTFVARIIDDSVRLKDKIKIFTSMVGKKSSLNPLKVKLITAKVAEMSTTTFSQGKTQRWALAWTYQTNIRLKLNSNEPKKNKSPLKLVVPESILTPYDMQTAQIWLLDVLNSLQVIYGKLESSSDSQAFRFVKYSVEAKKNTWSHQRRKRRAMRNDDEEISEKKSKSGNGLTFQTKPPYDDDGEKLSVAENESTPSFLKFEITLKQWENQISLEFLYVSGENVDALNQIVQYFRNKMNQNFSKIC